eukprot:3672986-Rhodomonas_salina.3
MTSEKGHVGTDGILLEGGKGGERSLARGRCIELSLSMAGPSVDGQAMRLRLPGSLSAVCSGCSDGNWDT